MDFKLFSLTILSLLFLLFDKGSGKIRLRASRVELEEINNEELPTSTEMPTNDQNNATDLPTGTYEQTSEATTASNYMRTRKGFAREINRWDEYEEEEEYEKEENDASPLVKFSEGTDSVKVRNEREAIELNETTENPQTIHEQSTANDFLTTTENNEAHEVEEEGEKKEEGEEDDDEQEQGEENPNPPEKEKNETKYVSNFDGEKCFITTSDKESEIFDEIYAVKGDVIYNEKQSEGIGLSTLEKLSNFKCGIKNYDQYSYCAKVKLFGKLELKDIREGKQLEPNNPKNITQYKEHSLQDTALVLIEGCFTCENLDKGPINITFWQINEAGPIKDACPEEEKLISHYILDYEKYNGGFIVGGILHERLCPARETLEDKIELASLKYKHNFKIVIEHSCAGNKETYVSKFAKAIDFENLKEHIFELRDLNINLNQNEETFDWDWNDKKEGLGYTYFAAKEFKQSNDSEIAQGEEVMHSEYITDENEEDDDEHNNEEENDHDEEKHGEKDNHDEEKHGEVINEEKSEEENEKKKNYEEEKMKKLHEELEVVAAEVKEEDNNMLKEVELEVQEKKNESLGAPEQFKENLEALNSTNEEKETNETINYQNEQITQEEEIKVEEKNPEKGDQITQEEEINEDKKEKEEVVNGGNEKKEEKNEENKKKEEDKDEKEKVEEIEKVDEVKKE
ncbi:unnamed protein product [Meloidogyne enterolobii]|uniref:Uncharacterized protein n=1 Tax=Meloidogyne enterolobii TaxID=390850 RepID=A0ACB0XWG1_MELEN